MTIHRSRTIHAVLVLALGVACGLFAGDLVRAADPPPIPIALDEQVEIRFRRAVPRRLVDADTIRIRTDDGRQAHGETITGRFVFDDATQRRVVINPEAVRDHHRLVLGMDRETATRKADRLLRSIERSGKFRKLSAIDRELRSALGESYGAGTRIDQEDVTAAYPPTLSSNNPLAQYRSGIAGDDDLWRAHIERDVSAFAQLRANSEFERFFHPVDPKLGVQSPTSVLRQREHRRVLIRRNRRTVQFLPTIPARASLEDAGFELDSTYKLVVRRPLRGARTVLTGRNARMPYTRGGSLLTTVGVDPVLAGIDERVGSTQAGTRPRIVNVTPPNGEQLVDATTDWEDPDNMFEVAIAARRTFSVRLRFAHPLDPRTVDETTFQLYKVAVAVGTPQETDVQELVEAGVFLAQSRLGEVRVDVTPVLNLDPQSRYMVRVNGVVRGLSGELLGIDYVSTFETN